MTDHEKMRQTLVSMRAWIDHWINMVDYKIMPCRSNFESTAKQIDCALGKTIPAMSTADRDLRGASLPAPTPEDIRALHLKLAAAAREAALEQKRGVK